jgi:phosphocarrier protein HPr
MSARASFTLVNRLGLHARAASRLVALLNEAAGDVWVVYADRRVNGKSILGLLMLAAPKGTTFEIEVESDDGQVILDAAAVLIESRFGEAE